MLDLIFRYQIIKQAMTKTEKRHMIHEYLSLLLMSSSVALRNACMS